MSPNNEPRLSKAERTAQAREQARIIRDAQLKKQKRNGWLIRGGVLVAAVAIVVIIALIVINTNKANEPVADSGPVPANMNAYGGITLGKDGAVIPPTTTEKTVDINNLGAAAHRVSRRRPLIWTKIGIKATGRRRAHPDWSFTSTSCARSATSLRRNYGAQLKALANEDKITVEYRALGFLDRFSGGTNYSSRAGAAAACVADTSPDKYQAFLDNLFANQPAENSKGLDNATLKKLATEVGAADISRCVDEKTFRPYVANTTGLASVHGVTATPTVFMDGQQWARPRTFDDFSARILAAKK